MLDRRLAATLRGMETPAKAIASPCTLVCTMNPATGWCYGCHRTIEEIAGWRGYSDDQRTLIIERLKDRAKSAG